VGEGGGQLRKEGSEQGETLKTTTEPSIKKSAKPFLKEKNHAKELGKGKKANEKGEVLRYTFDFDISRAGEVKAAHLRRMGGEV